MKAVRNISQVSAEQNLINKTQCFFKDQNRIVAHQTFPEKKSNDKMHGKTWYKVVIWH